MKGSCFYENVTSGTCCVALILVFLKKRIQSVVQIARKSSEEFFALKEKVHYQERRGAIWKPQAALY